MKTYAIGDLAQLINIHPNTIRMYEALGFIHQAKRNHRNERIFNDDHLFELTFLKMALRGEVLQDGLRKEVRQIIKTVANHQYDKAEILLKAYSKHINRCLYETNQTHKQVQAMLEKPLDDINFKPLTRPKAAEHINVSIDTLRTWERSGLLEVEKSGNRCQYDMQNLHTARIIKTLRTANYSLTAILRLISTGDTHDIGTVLNTPQKQEPIISVCDRLEASLNALKQDAKQLMRLLNEHCS